MTVPLAPHELELLELLVNAYEQDREELFVVANMSKGTAIKHTGFPVSDWRNDGAALAGLAAVGLLLVQSYDGGGHPKSFYLPTGARAELEAARREAERRAAAEAEREAAERGAGAAPLSLAQALERMISHQKEHPGGFFTPYDTRPNPSIGYSGVQGQHLSLLHGEFARLLTCGALEKREDRFALYYLSPNAADILAAEQRLQSDGPLAAAERRIGAVENRREATARLAGWLVAAGVVLLILYLVLNRERLFPPGELAGVLYEVVTVVLGLTGLAVAALVSRLVRAGVNDLLRWWLDPRAGRESS